MHHHQSYVDVWLESLRHGLFNGRAYSEHCIKLYDYQMNWYFARYDEVSLQNFKKGLLEIPIAQYSKRLKLFEALTCFSKFLIQEGDVPLTGTHF